MNDLYVPAEYADSDQKTSRLTLMRHAKSSWDAVDIEDHDRPLNERGLRAATVMAKWIYEERLIPDLILTSSALRTVQTSQALVRTWHDLGTSGPRVKNLSSLYHASADHIIKTGIDWMYRLSHIMIVSHNPGLEDLILQLAPNQTHSDKVFPTATVASFSLVTDDWPTWRQNLPDLSHFQKPRDIVPSSQASHLKTHDAQPN